MYSFLEVNKQGLITLNEKKKENDDILLHHTAKVSDKKDSAKGKQCVYSGSTETQTVSLTKKYG